MNKCPNCKCSWIGGIIPKDIAHNYSGTHWRREIGIDGGYMGVYDGIVAVNVQTAIKNSLVIILNGQKIYLTNIKRLA